jgi:hypothetical protein
MAIYFEDISRASLGKNRPCLQARNAYFPLVAQFMLVAAMNPTHFGTVSCINF